MIAQLRAGFDLEDSTFDTIFPRSWKALCEIHFTPVKVAKRAARYLVDSSRTKVLDIGSGAGKFCMIGAACTEGFFIGVEQRPHLHQVAKRISRQHGLNSTCFIHSNIIHIDFNPFDSFFIFNPFFENKLPGNPMDATVRLSRELYFDYSQYVKIQLDKMPPNTKLATYYSYGDEIPESYRLKKRSGIDKLLFWQKTGSE